jgi:ribokinase
MNKQITVIGSTNVDFIMKMKRLPQVGETITEADYMQTFGGKGANQALGAARSGGKVNFISAVGDDPYVARMLEDFARDGISIEHVKVNENISTGTALVMIGDDGSNYLSVAPCANYRLFPADIDQAIDVIDRSEYVILQYEIPVETLKHVLDTCQEMKKKVIWNFAPARYFDPLYLGKVEILIVNETEAEILSGIKVIDEKNTRDAAKKLLEHGPGKIIITLGKKGAFWTEPGKEGEFMPAFDVDVVDTTAAGDVFCGALATSLTEGKELKEAIVFASAASALTVTKLGAQPSIPYRKVIDEFLKKQ